MIRTTASSSPWTHTSIRATRAREGASYTLHCRKYTESRLPYGVPKNYMTHPGVKVIEKTTYGSVELVKRLHEGGFRDIDVVGVYTNISVLHNVVLIYNTVNNANISVLAAVCGLYCEACSLYIATNEDPARLTALAKTFRLPEEEMRCYGCRSETRGPYCKTCEMFVYAAERGIDFYSKCDEYSCDTLKAFQAEQPHRAELWEDLERIAKSGTRTSSGLVKSPRLCPHLFSVQSKKQTMPPPLVP